MVCDNTTEFIFWSKFTFSRDSWEGRFLPVPHFLQMLSSASFPLNFLQCFFASVTKFSIVDGWGSLLLLLTSNFILAETSLSSLTEIWISAVWYLHATPIHVVWPALCCTCWGSGPFFCSRNAELALGGTKPFHTTARITHSILQIRKWHTKKKTQKLFIPEQEDRLRNV